MTDYYETRSLEIAAYLLACDCRFPEVVLKDGNRKFTFRFYDPEGEIHWFVQNLTIPPADGGPWVSMTKLMDGTKKLKGAMDRAR